jgi:hypothetical protein
VEIAVRLIYVLILLINILICGYFGSWIVKPKGYPPYVGVIVGALFGPIGLAICALLPMTETGRDRAEMERQKRCPSCDREVSFMCRVCPRCEHRFV